MLQKTLKANNRTIVIINQGQIIADGTFAELQHQRPESLEQLFAQLTGSDGQTGIAEEFVHTLKNESV